MEKLTMEEIAECLELSVEDVEQIAAVQIVQQLLQKAFWQHYCVIQKKNIVKVLPYFAVYCRQQTTLENYMTIMGVVTVWLMPQKQSAAMEFLSEA